MEKPEFSNRLLYQSVLKALGVVTQGQGLDALLNQKADITGLIEQLKSMEGQLKDKIRIFHAQETADQRLQPTDDHYLAHMSHCYGLDDDPAPYDTAARFSCKYGQDDICPAALFEEPYDEFLRIHKISLK